MRRAVAVVGTLVLLGGIATVAVAGRPSQRPSDDDRGRELYDRHCVACHGVDFAGDGPAAAALVSKVPDLRDKADPANVDGWVDAVVHGKGASPSFAASFDQADARRVLRWAGMLAKGTAPQPAPAAPTEGGDEAGGN